MPDVGCSELSIHYNTPAQVSRHVGPRAVTRPSALVLVGRLSCWRCSRTDRRICDGVDGRQRSRARWRRRPMVRLRNPSLQGRLSAAVTTPSHKLIFALAATSKPTALDPGLSRRLVSRLGSTGAARSPPRRRIGVIDAPFFQNVTNDGTSFQYRASTR